MSSHSTAAKNIQVWDDVAGQGDHYEDVCDAWIDGYDSFEGPYDESRSVTVNKFRNSTWGKQYEHCVLVYHGQEEPWHVSTDLKKKGGPSDANHDFQRCFGLHSDLTLEVFWQLLPMIKSKKFFVYKRNRSPILDRKDRYHFHMLPIELKLLIGLNRLYNTWTVSLSVSFDRLTSIRGLSCRCYDHCFNCLLYDSDEWKPWVKQIKERLGQTEEVVPRTTTVETSGSSSSFGRRSKWDVAAEKRQRAEAEASILAETNQPIDCMSDAKIREKYWLSTWGKNFKECIAERRGDGPNASLFKSRFKLNINKQIVDSVIEEARVKKVFDIERFVNEAASSGTVRIELPYGTPQSFSIQELREFRLIPTMLKVMVPMFHWVRNGDVEDEQLAEWSRMSVKYVKLCFDLMAQRWNMMAFYEWTSKKKEEIELQKREERKAIAREEREEAKAKKVAMEEAERAANPEEYAAKKLKEKEEKAKKRRKRYVHPDEPWLDLYSEDEKVTPSGKKIAIPTTTNPEINAMYQLMVQYDRSDLVHQAMNFFSINGQLRMTHQELLRLGGGDKIYFEKEIEKSIAEEKVFIERMVNRIKRDAGEISV